MNILIILCVGLLVGYIADSIASGRGPGKKIDIGLAIVGALVATLIYLNPHHVGHTTYGSVGAAIIGACALVSPFIVFFRGRNGPRLL